MTSGLAQAQRFSGLTRNLEKFWSAVQNFSAALWLKCGDTGHAPIQLHTSHLHGKRHSQIAGAASYKQLVARWAWLDRLHQWSGTLSTLWLAENSYQANKVTFRKYASWRGCHFQRAPSVRAFSLCAWRRR